MLLFLDHILYRRAHFIRDALCSLAITEIATDKMGFFLPRRTSILTINAQITTAADYILKYYFLLFFWENIRLDITYETSA